MAVVSASAEVTATMVAALTATGDSGGVDSDGGAFKLQTGSDCKDAAVDSVVTPQALGFSIVGTDDRPSGSGADGRGGSAAVDAFPWQWCRVGLSRGDGDGGGEV